MPNASPKTTRRRKPAKATPPPAKLNRLLPPEHLDPRDWQVGLRQQFGPLQNFTWKNIGDDSVFSDFSVDNPNTNGRYRVSIRGSDLGSNHCNCGDFVTNQLGTCKHIEFVLDRLRRQRGGKAALRRGNQHAHSELRLQCGTRRSLRLWPGGDLPAHLHADAERLFEAVDGWRLPDTRLARLPAFLKACVESKHPIRISEDARQFLQHARAEVERRAKLALVYPAGAADAGLGTLVRTPLFPYQVEGVWFIAQAGRALLADEMGLGKTVQAIAAAELWRRDNGAERLLIVCPTSLKAQWAHELLKFAGRAALMIEGNASERARLYAAPAAIKIASYDSLTRDFEYASAWQPDVLIVDEAQRVKNWDTLAARALKRLPSRFAIVLTGTPMENKLEELLSVVQLVDRHRLGPTWQFLHNHQLRDESGRTVGYRDLDRIGESLAPILLRRRKREVLQQLPVRSDQRLMVELTPLQRQRHDENRDQVALIVQRWRRTKHLSDGDRKRLQAALQKMRMACTSSYLLDRESNQSSKIPELLAWLQPQLEDAAAKCVIFSAWIGTHELIAAELESLRIGYVQFNGSVPARERARRVEQFRDDPTCRVFLATDAGGVGLNLQHAASLIVNMDLPWNPAVLEQRIGRVYRLGQTRRVEVLNLVASNSIEEQMLSVLAFKRSLFEGALDGGAGEVKLDGSRLTRFMRTVEGLTGEAASAAPFDTATVDEQAELAVATTEESAAASASVIANATLTPSPTTAALTKAAPTTAVPADDFAATSDSTKAEPSIGASITPPSHPSPATTDQTLKHPEHLPATQQLANYPTAALLPLLQAAGHWFTQLAAQISDGQPLARVEADPHTGQPSLRLPLPPAALLRQFADALDTMTKQGCG